MKTFLKKLFVVLLSTAVGLCLAELVFRVVPFSSMELDADIIWNEQKPDLGKDYKDARTVIRGQAFREERFGAEVFGEGFTRVLFLGDSFTAGANVRDCHRFSERLEIMLNEEMAGKGSLQRIHIFNAGRGGTSPIVWERYYKILQPVYKPHAVFAVFFLRDGTDLKTAVLQNKEIIDPIMQR